MSLQIEREFTPYQEYGFVTYIIRGNTGATGGNAGDSELRGFTPYQEYGFVVRGNRGQRRGFRVVMRQDLNADIAL